MSQKVVAKFSEPAEPVEILVSSIVQISAAMKRLEATRLTRRAIVLLLRQETGLSFRAINDVIDGLSNLEKTWLKPIKQ